MEEVQSVVLHTVKLESQKELCICKFWIFQVSAENTKNRCLSIQKYSKIATF